MTPDIAKLVGSPAAALPEELGPIIAALMEGRVRSLVVIVEEVDGSMGDLFCLDMDDDEPSNRFAVLGAIENVKRDFLRCAIESRVSYTRTEDDDDDGH